MEQAEWMHLASECDAGIIALLSGVVSAVSVASIFGKRMYGMMAGVAIWSAVWMGVRPRVQRFPSIVTPAIAKALPKFMHSGEWQLAIDTVVSLLHNIQKDDFKAKTRFWLPINLGLVWAAEQIQARNLQGRLKPSRLPKNAHRMALFSWCSYGAIVMATLGVKPRPPICCLMVPSEERDITWIAKRTGVLTEHITHANMRWSEPSMCPRHFVAVDTKTKSIVISIRGTASLVDIALDLTCNTYYDPHLRAYAHHGILNSAYSTLECVNKTLVETLHKFPQYDIILTGHSLGGGVSLMMAALLSAAKRIAIPRVPALPKHTKITAYAYGPPPIAVPTEGKRFGEGAEMFSFIHANDVVPRLSVDSVKGMLADLRRVDHLDISLRERIAAIANPLKAREILDKVRRVIALCQDNPVQDEFAPDTDLPSLQIPGKVFLLPRTQPIHPRISKKEYSKHNYKLHQARYGEVKNTFFTPQAFLDHLPKNYEDSLRAVCAGKCDICTTSDFELM